MDVFSLANSFNRISRIMPESIYVYRKRRNKTFELPQFKKPEVWLALGALSLQGFDVSKEIVRDNWWEWKQYSSCYSLWKSLDSSFKWPGWNADSSSQPVRSNRIFEIWKEYVRCCFKMQLSLFLTSSSITLCMRRFFFFFFFLVFFAERFKIKLLEFD